MREDSPTTYNIKYATKVRKDRARVRLLDDPAFCVRFERALEKITKETRPLFKKLEDAERLTAEDFAVTINCRD